MNTMIGTLNFSRALSEELRRHSCTAAPEEIRGWPVGRVRDALLWLSLREGGPGEHRGLGEYLHERRDLRRCDRCGCTEDNACLDTTTGRPCSWAGPSLCSGCVGGA